MRIDEKLFGYATGMVAAIVYFISGFFAAIGSGATQGFFSFVLHVNLMGLVRPIDVVSFAVGLVLFTALFGGCAWLVARFYNLLAARATATRAQTAPAAR